VEAALLLSMAVQVPAFEERRTALARLIAVPT
jgi:hypothetical protein